MAGRIARQRDDSHAVISFGSPSRQGNTENRFHGAKRRRDDSSRETRAAYRVRAIMCTSNLLARSGNNRK